LRHSAFGNSAIDGRRFRTAFASHAIAEDRHLVAVPFKTFVSDQEIVRLRLEGFTPEEIGRKLTEPLTTRSVNRRISGPIADAVRQILNAN
jgi:hypothetical protein